MLYLANPLLVECSAEGSASNKSIDCLINRPIVNSMCTFDDGAQQPCKYSKILPE